MTLIGCLFDDSRIIEETIGTKKLDFVTSSGKGKVVILAYFVLEEFSLGRIRMSLVEVIVHANGNFCREWRTG